MGTNSVYAIAIPTKLVDIPLSIMAAVIEETVAMKRMTPPRESNAIPSQQLAELTIRNERILKFISLNNLLVNRFS
jgi:hypothetical protein